VQFEKALELAEEQSENEIAKQAKEKLESLKVTKSSDSDLKLLNE